MYENIVVAFDGSEFSRAALAESAKWVRRHGGKAVLLHAVFFDEQEFAIAPEQRDMRFEVGKKACFQAKYTASDEFGLNGNLEALVCEGEPHEVIVDVAGSKNADLIAMGTHGNKGLKKLFMGSVASRVIQSSPCDVLVVKPSGDRAEKYGSILLSYDGTEFGKKALGRACELAKTEGSEITALYVIPRYEEMIEFFMSNVIRENIMHEARRTMQSAVDTASKLGVTIKTEITEGNESDRIAETALRLKSNLIIRGSHGWSGINRAIIGNVIENVIVSAPCPVLAVR